MSLVLILSQIWKTDDVAVRWDQIEAEYQPAIVVTVDDQPKLTVYRREGDSPPLTYRVEEYERLFDLGMTPDRLARSPYSGTLHALKRKRRTLKFEYGRERRPGC